ncbi:MAG: hypothetical protein AAB597_02310 [Patescibacteria group bacterium]
MSEKTPPPESAPEPDPYQAFEALVGENKWSLETEEKLRTLLESNESDMYMIYLTYKESGLVDELSKYERRLYDWLKSKFEEVSE